MKPCHRCHQPCHRHLCEKCRHTLTDREIVAAVARRMLENADERYERFRRKQAEVRYLEAS